MLLLRWLLFPFAILYGVVVGIRNQLFDTYILSSKTPPKPSICIGNLSVGGTGKSPVTNYLIELLKNEHRVIVLSRGYGRKSKGFRIVEESNTSQEVGDEPLAYKIEHKQDITVAIAEKRWAGIKQLKLDDEKSVLLLDDAFQHRAVKTGLSILLSTYASPFYKDYVIPFGRLREARSGANRSDIIVITKCPDTLNDDQKKSIHAKLLKYKKPVFFSKIVYSPLRAIGKIISTDIEHVLLVSGIANPTPLLNHLQSTYETTHLNFADHHDFNAIDLTTIHKKFDTFANQNAIIVTTFKDYMRLKSIFDKNELTLYPWYVQEMSVIIENENEFNKLIRNYVRKI